MTTSRAFHELHTIRKMRELIRSWWRIELGFAYPDGYVADHENGVVIPSDNPFCRASLHAPDGFQACNRSIELAVRGLRELGGGRPRAMKVETCHLGFPLLFVPLVHRGQFLGALFTSGFLQEEDRESRALTIRSRTEEAQFELGDMESAMDRVPILKARDFGYLCDLMEMMGEEILLDPASTRTLAHRNEETANPSQVRLKFEDIIGQSSGMQELYQMIERVAPSESTVLITGEDGTGKELVAQAIFSLSERNDKPFVGRNCSAMNENLLESELFGHVRGSFTGASRDREGVFELANNGTLFLDEIGDTSGRLQVRLLRVLQEGTYVPVGGGEEKSSDVRLITATNRPLKRLVASGEFRKDLYYRLNVIRLHLPPLRDRMDDLPYLCDHFLGKLADKTGRGEKRLSAEVIELMHGYDWPGNIRELQGELERMYILSGDVTVIDTTYLSPELERKEFVVRPSEKGTLADAVASLEKGVIGQGLIRTHWNKTQLAGELGISRTTLIRKVKEHGLEDGRLGKQ